MSETSPQIIPLGSLADAAAAGADLAWQEQQAIAPEGPGTLTGYIAP
jgi:hypothetical protein